MLTAVTADSGEQRPGAELAGHLARAHGCLKRVHQAPAREL